MTCRDLQHFLIYGSSLMTLICFINTLPPGENEIVMEMINMQLNKVSHWCSANKLTINLLKTNYTVISGSRL